MVPNEFLGDVYGRGLASISEDLEYVVIEENIPHQFKSQADYEQLKA